MKITIDRFTSDDDAIVSRVLVNGHFVCFGFENEHLAVKSPARIPPGTYPVKLSFEGESNDQHRIHFPDIHKGMLQVEDAPQFESPQIHTGNDQIKTQGGLLLGEQVLTRSHEMRVSQSDNAYKSFYPLVVDAAAAGDLSITFEDNDDVDADVMDVIEHDFKDEGVHLGTHDTMIASSTLGILEKYELSVWRFCLIVVVVMLLVALV